jgi:hypothetical protein
LKLHGIGAKFPLTVLLVSVSVPELLIPPPDAKQLGRNGQPPSDGALPLRMVSFETVTWAVELEILTTVLEAPPSIIVVLAPAPITVTVILIVRFSV